MKPGNNILAIDLRFNSSCDFADCRAYLGKYYLL